jgi:hypothetical protein
LGNGEIVGCGARNAAARCERRKGKIQVRREPPEKRMKKNAKILKNFYITQMAALVVVNPNRFRLPNAATKKAVRIVDYNYTIQIFQKKNNIKKSPKIPRKRL